MSQAKQKHIAMLRRNDEGPRKHGGGLRVEWRPIKDPHWRPVQLDDTDRLPDHLHIRHLEFHYDGGVSSWMECEIF